MRLCKFVWNGSNTCLTIMPMQMDILLSLIIFIASLLIVINRFHLFLFFRLRLFRSREISKKLIPFVYHGCVRGETIRAMDANATNAVLGANSAIALASSMNDPSVALVVFNQRDIFIKIKLMYGIQSPTVFNHQPNFSL